jgi:hypothetical protein
MTQPNPETIEREKDKLFVTDAEVIRRMGVPEKLARAALQVLDANKTSGFPRKQKLWGDRRYWPAVRAWLDKNYGKTAQERLNETTAGPSLRPPRSPT